MECYIPAVMSRKYDIVGQAAWDRVVEGIIANVTKGGARFRPELQDFAQMIYLALLEKDDALIERLHDRGQLKYYITAMVTRQWYTGHSAFRDAFSKYQWKVGDFLAEGFTVVDEDEYWNKQRIEREAEAGG